MDSKKCIVLDLDNTLWGGIIGEDGMDGIKLSLSGEGAGFIAFQQALLDLYDRGIILAINSRNNPEDAMKVIRSHPNMILRENNFAATRINWDDKSDNIVSLAKELNIGLDSMVFFDDDPMNRASVKNALPEVEVPEMPSDPSQYAKFLIGLPYFEVKAITDEDKMRGNLYVTERLRSESEKSFANRDEFLKSLSLELEVFVNDSSHVARLSQLTGKTNQFNCNKNPLTEEDIISFMKNPDYRIFHGRLTDRFGDHGIIIFAVIAVSRETWNIDNFLMSCRVIGRGVEEAFLSAIAKLAKDEGAFDLSITFVKTEKNAPAENFVKKYFRTNPTGIEKILRRPNWISLKYGKIQ